MSRMKPLTIALTASLVVLGACNDSTSPEDLLTMEAAFMSTPAGFSEVSSSFAAGPEASDLPWLPEHGRGGPRMMGGRGGPGLGAMMGGGMHADFIGGAEFGRGPDRGPFAARLDESCTYSAGTGDVTCGPTTRRGLTVTRILTFTTLDGTTQERPDSTTHSVHSRATVSGTIQRGQSVTANVQHSSDRTVTGLEVGSTLRTVNGSAQGEETASGTTRDGAAFTAVRTVSESTTGLTIPMENGRPTYPTAGTVARTMSAVMTVDGEARSTTRSETITYDGSATAKLVIVRDGTTRNCTLALPRGRPVCE